MPPPARINAGISPRIIQISLSGSDRKAQAKASALHNSQLHESHLIRSTTEAKICDADWDMTPSLPKNYFGYSSEH
jgi:hypothetical protein